MSRLELPLPKAKPRPKAAPGYFVGKAMYELQTLSMNARRNGSTNEVALLNKLIAVIACDAVMNP